MDVSLQCGCGRVRGLAKAVTPRSGFRLVCYCDDCQAFARLLGRPDILDQAGGTNIFQMAIGRFEITAGKEAVRCLRLSERGVFRWYADCCRTPIGNTMGPGVPMIGVIRNFMRGQADDAMGPPLCRIYDGSAVGPLPLRSPPLASAGVFLRRLGKLLTWAVLGLARPNPFFDPVSGAPCSEPQMPSADDRA